MKSRAFDYLCAESLADVAAGFNAHGGDAIILAGGQSIVPALNLRLTETPLLIDINRLPGLDDIRHEDGFVHIGALCRHEQVRRSEVIMRHVPILAEAIAHVAHPAIRNRGTIGGSLCNADPAAELPACMLALGAKLTLESGAGRREVTAEDFFLGLFETCLEAGEVLTGISVPAIKSDEIHFFDEIARRRGDYALAGLAAIAKHESGNLISIVFAFLSCDDKPVLASELARLVQEAAQTPLDDREIAAALAQDINPPEDEVTSAETRLHLAGVLARRALAHFRERVGS